MNRVLLANPVGPLAARKPHHTVPRFNPPLQSETTSGRSTFYPYRTILHDTAHLRLPPILPPSSSYPAAAATPSISRTHLRPARLILPVPPASRHLIHPPRVLLVPPPPFLPSPPSTTSCSLSLSFACLLTYLLTLYLLTLPHPFPIANRAMS